MKYFKQIAIAGLVFFGGLVAANLVMAEDHRHHGSAETNASDAGEGDEDREQNDASFFPDGWWKGGGLWRPTYSD